MKYEDLSYQQVFHTFDIQPVYESTFCCLFKNRTRHFCVYHDKESGKIQCWYINVLDLIKPDALLSLLSPYHDLKYITVYENNNEYQFKESVTSDFIVKWCYSIRKTNLSDEVPETAREFITIFDKCKDIYLGEDNNIKLILRDKSGNITDLLQYRDRDFGTNFSDNFGSWNYWPDTSSLLHNLYILNPYLIPPFFEEENQYHYHTHIVSGFNYPEFTNMFMHFAQDSDQSLEPSIFLLSGMKDYIDFIGFLCSYATVKTKKNFFKIYLYTDYILLEIIPFDSPLGHTGLRYKSWQTMFSQQLGNNITLKKWQTGTSIFTGIPLKIDVLHQFSKDFIHLNQFSIRVINSIFDIDTDQTEDPLTDHHDEQIF
jgi:hypothetical protein